MMKMDFKHTKKRSVSFLLLFLLLFIGVPNASAVVEQVPEPQATPIQVLSPTTSGVCSQLDQLASAEKLDELKADIISVQKKRLVTMIESRQYRNEKRIKVREKIREFYNKFLLKFEGEADTDEQKRAVRNFKKKFHNMTEERFNEIETLNNSYRADLDSVIEKKQQTIEDSIKKFGIEIKDAFDKARLECYSGMTEVQVKTNLITRIKVVKETYKGSVGIANNYRQEVLTLSQTLKSDIEEVNQSFKDALETAMDELDPHF